MLIMIPPLYHTLLIESYWKMTERNHSPNGIYVSTSGVIPIKSGAVFIKVQNQREMYVPLSLPPDISFRRSDFKNIEP